jgi:hypothetical protein
MMASHDSRVEKSQLQQHMVIEFRCRQKSSAAEKKSTAEVVNETSFGLVHVLALVQAHAPWQQPQDQTAFPPNCSPPQ